MSFGIKTGRSRYYVHGRGTFHLLPQPKLKDKNNPFIKITFFPAINYFIQTNRFALRFLKILIFLMFGLLKN
jgi:hypothetical protein